MIGRWQLVANGVGEDAIDLRLATGHLHRLVLAGRRLTGVYAVGRPLLHPGLGWQWAAWLACGPESVISDRTAADVGDLLTSRRLEVTIPPDARRRRRARPSRSFSASAPPSRHDRSVTRAEIG
jgi:hypothetical protein